LENNKKFMIEDLKNFTFFSDWTEKELEEINPYLQDGKIEKNTVLFRQNEICGKMYFVKTGCIELRIVLTGKEETQLARIKNGEIFGEMAVIDNKPRSATAVAFVDTTLITLTKEHFYELLNKGSKEVVSKFLLSIIKELNLRLRSVNEEIRNLKSYS